MEHPGLSRLEDFDPEDTEGAFGRKDDSSSGIGEEDNDAGREHYTNVGYAYTLPYTIFLNETNEGYQEEQAAQAPASDPWTAVFRIEN